MTICAILLAPGLHSAQGRMHVRRIALAALAALCRPVVIAEEDDLRGELAGLPVDLTGDRSVRGSLAIALAVTPHLEGAVLLRADQPHVTTAAIVRLCSVFRDSRAGIVASEHDHTIGLPALFGRPIFPELLALAPESDPRIVIAAHARQLVTVPLPEAATQIESAEEYALLNH